MKVSLSLDRVGKNVVGDIFGELNRLDEDVGPVTNAGEVILEASAAVGEVLREFLQGEAKEVKTVENRLVGTNLEVGDSFVDIGGQVGDVTCANLDLRQVVVTNEAVDESSNNVVSIIKGGTISVVHERIRHVTEFNEKEVSNNFTSLEVFLGSDVSLGGADVSLDLDNMTSSIFLNLLLKSIDISDN